MKNNKISFVALFDALSQGSDRFRTVKGLNFATPSISNSVVNSDKYSVSFAGTHNDRNVIVKIFLDPYSERCINIMESLSKLNSLKFPFISEFSIFKEELIIINNDKSVFKSDIVIIYDDGILLNDFTETVNYSDINIISDFTQLYIELLNNNILLDLFSFQSLRYRSDKRIYISADANFILTRSTPKDIIGFKNFLLMQLINAAMIKLECAREETDFEAEFICIDNSGTYDLRKSDYFNSTKYSEKIMDAINIVGRYSDIDTNLLKEVVASSKISDVIKIISNLVDVNYTPFKNSYYRNNRDFDVTGGNYENRIAIRNNITEKFGYLDFNDQLVIDFKYDDVTDFNEEFAVCRIGEQYGAINREDEVVLEFKYDELEWDSVLNNFIWQIGELKGILKRKDIIKL